MGSTGEQTTLGVVDSFDDTDNGTVDGTKDTVPEESDDGDSTIPDNACVKYEACGNTVPANGTMCGPCLDAARARDRERQAGENR